MEKLQEDRRKGTKKENKNKVQEGTKTDAYMKPALKKSQQVTHQRRKIVSMRKWRKSTWKKRENSLTRKCAREEAAEGLKALEKNRNEEDLTDEEDDETETDRGRIRR